MPPLVAQVVRAVSRQLDTLNTNARYLHENLSNHAEMLAATMPDPLEVGLIPAGLQGLRIA